MWTQRIGLDRMATKAVQSLYCFPKPSKCFTCKMQFNTYSTLVSKCLLFTALIVTDLTFVDWNKFCTTG